ncbi:VPLPA-CTERM sorting domain-containing protein [Rhodovulum sulfidophilum]|uniref:VPLPA-CTERM sorting domain-containing protein n=1 Tax=Rhodovulum sulfidophilum TaxID=35806 RepID=UPI002115E25C|nr:VPLPA-CTERM sorting domain-containing protein [Rhodovulum sulfidophilum]
MKTLLATTAIAAMMTVGAQAATMSGSTGGTFTGVVNGHNVGTSANTAIWPDDNSWLVCWIGPNCKRSTDQSSLEITEVGFSENVTAPGTVAVGEIIWHNAASLSGSAGWWPDTYPGTDSSFSLSANMSIDYAQPTDLPATSQGLSFAIDNTTNPPGDAISSLIFSDLNYGSILPLDLGEGLTVTGYSFELVDGTYSTFDPESGIWTLQEDRSAALRIVANVDVAPVPVPAAGLMLLGGLGGLAALRRKKKS